MSSIRIRVIATALIAVVLGGTLLLFATDRAYRNILEATSARSLAVTERTFGAIGDARSAALRAALVLITESPTLRDSFASRDREALFASSFPRFEALRDQIGITRWYYYEPGGRVFLRVYRGDEALDSGSFDDPSRSKSLARARETGETSYGLELGTQALSVRVVAPFVDADGETIGYVGLGERVDDFLTIIAGQTGDQYAMFLDKRELDADDWRDVREARGERNNWDDFDDVVLADLTLEDESPLTSIFREVSGADHMNAPHSLDMTAVDGRTYSMGTFPLRDVRGESIGFVAMLRDVTELTSVFRTTQLTIVLTLIVASVTLSLLLALVLERMVFRRVDNMVTDVEHLTMAVAAGDWDSIRREAGDAPDDEIGRLEHFLSSFLTLVSAALRTRGREESRRNSDS